jgi:hypothetical protein
MRKVAVAAAFVAAFSALALFGLRAPGITPFVFGDGWEEPEPSVDSIEVLDAGCHDDIRGMSMTSSDGTWIGTVNATSPHTEVSAQIRLVSPDRADVTAYRVDVEAHNTSAPAPRYNCTADEGAVRYRLEYSAPYPDGATGLRVTRYVNGELWGCGGSTSGPELGCARMHADVPAHWSNRTTE